MAEKKLMRKICIVFIVIIFAMTACTPRGGTPLPPTPSPKGRGSVSPSPFQGEGLGERVTPSPTITASATMAAPTRGAALPSETGATSVSPSPFQGEGLGERVGPSPTITASATITAPTVEAALPTTTAPYPASTETPRAVSTSTAEAYPAPALITATITAYPEPAVPTAGATATPRPTVSWRETTLSILTYQYEDALYTEPDSAIYPYPKLDTNKVGAPVQRAYRAVVVENEYIALTLLPELGGRIYRFVFKPAGQNLTYNNAVIKPTHWGPPEQGWWLAVGGIEFCLPVDEHGYLTAEPWDYAVTDDADGGVVVTVSQHEETRDLDVAVSIAVRPQSAAVEITTQLGLRPTETQAGSRPVEYQYWTNAMLTLGGERVSPQTEFIYPADRVIVHSTGDAELPSERGMMSWPVYNGRDFSRYANWRDWLGFFVPAPRVERRLPGQQQRSLPNSFIGAYNHESELGIVRVFDATEMPGVKLFAFGTEFGDCDAFTDRAEPTAPCPDYFEMWGGATRTFWDYATLEAGATREWREWWYPIWRTAGLDYANETAALSVTDERVHVAVSVPLEGIVTVFANEEQLFVADATIAPDEPYRAEIPEIAAGAEYAVQLLSRDGAVMGQVKSNE